MIRNLLFVLLVSGTVCCAGFSPGQDTPPSPGNAVEPAKEAPGPATPPPAGAGKERPMFISIPPLFEPLKRAPVMFWHDKHTAALKAEGCEACHPAKNNLVEFSFPKARNESSRKALMASYHDACITCHTQRADARKSTGPVTCGECHDGKKACTQKEYLPIVPANDGMLPDPYHRQCTACHLKPAESAKAAPELDWKSFRVLAQRRIEQDMPEAVFDYYTHDKHLQALAKKCELCHYISPTLKAKLDAEGKTATSQDWVREEEAGKSLKKKESAHFRCINCHLGRVMEKKSHGPVDCRDCHVSRVRSAKDMETVTPPDYDKKERILINADKASLAAVPFDHKAHIAASRSCDDCHHDTLEACVKCHTIKGAKEGGFITLAEAYHKSGSKWSCIGCHEREQAKADCAGCHSLRPSGLRATDCAACHTGKMESLDRVGKLPDPATLFPPDLTNEFQIAVLEKEFEPAGNKHTDIARKLTDISNNSKLASFFHQDETTVCYGCHHLAPIQKQKRVPACSACHTTQNTPSGNVPTLLGAYHQACLGCHRKMGHPEEKMPQACTGCHKEKKQQKPPAGQQPK